MIKREKKVGFDLNKIFSLFNFLADKSATNIFYFIFIFVSNFVADKYANKYTVYIFFS
jgi:hypothetical protein